MLHWIEGATCSNNTIKSSSDLVRTTEHQPLMIRTVASQCGRSNITVVCMHNIISINHRKAFAMLFNVWLGVTCFPEVDRLPIVCLRACCPKTIQQQQQCHQKVPAPLCPFPEGPCCAPPSRPHGPNQSKSTQFRRSARGASFKKIVLVPMEVKSNGVTESVCVCKCMYRVENQCQTWSCLAPNLWGWSQRGGCEWWFRVPPP